MENTKKVIALGFFDGVHLGHGALLRRVAEVAGELNAVPAALTFDVHPDDVISGGHTRLLTTPQERAALMKELYGIREVILVHFDDRMMQMPWEEFVSGYLVGQHNAVHVVAGQDFRFGHRGRGTAEDLAAKCAELGVGCDIIPPVKLDGVTVSSSAIRALLAQGETGAARRLLGHPLSPAVPT